MVKLNNLVESIKFNFEIEKECKLPFLDVLVHRINASFKILVYRKPESNNYYILIIQAIMIIKKVYLHCYVFK